jgi:hypothetical protein
LSNNTTASYNTAVGKYALVANTTGTHNTAVGYYSLSANTTGDNNIAIGRYSLGTNTTGAQNTALGYSALEVNTTGFYNTGVGYNALSANTTGYSNVGVGHKALLLNTTGTDNNAVGHLALDANTTGYGNNALGTNTLGKNITGFNNSAIGTLAGQNATSGDNNTFIGYTAGVTGSPGGNITTQNNTILLGDENISVSHIQVDWTIASDQRDKTDFTALDVGLSFVNALEPVTYKWDKRSKYIDKSDPDVDLDNVTHDGTHKEDWLDVGFKAQAVEALELAAGYKIADKTNLTTSLTSDGKQYGIQYTKFVPILVKALQELSTKNDALEARIAALEA